MEIKINVSEQRTVSIFRVNKPSTQNTGQSTDMGKRDRVFGRTDETMAVVQRADVSGRGTGVGTKMSQKIYRGADKSLARPNSQCILFDGENISFDASLVIYINSTNIPPIMIINRIYETQNLLSL